MKKKISEQMNSQKGGRMKKLSFLLIIAFFISLNLIADGVQPVGSGTEADPYLVETLDNLLWVSTNEVSWDKAFLQTANIDASDTQNWNNGEGFSPIGIYEYEVVDNPFTGFFNGDGHIINSLHINQPNETNIGLFGYVVGATIFNLKLENVDIVGFSAVGSLVGQNTGSVIINCFSTGSIEGGEFVGGLVGHNWESTISNSTCNCNVNGGFYIGGLAGENYNSSISKSFSNGCVIGNYSIGGLVGENYDNSTIANCFSTNNVEGNEFVGGLVGYNYYMSTISKCYSTGSVDGNNDFGGLVGSQNEFSSVNNSFWDIETSGITNSEGGTGKTTLEMKNVSTFTELTTIGLDSPWDFVDNPFDDIAGEDIWNIEDEINNSYPYLTDPLTGIDNKEIELIPELAKLKGNFPNPFNPSTTIKYNLQQNADVRIEVYNIKGQIVITLVNQNVDAGYHSVLWNGKDTYNNLISSGLYVYKLVIDNQVIDMKKCLLLK